MIGTVEWLIAQSLDVDGGQLATIKGTNPAGREARWWLIQNNVAVKDTAHSLGYSQEASTKVLERIALLWTLAKGIPTEQLRTARIVGGITRTEEAF